MQKRRLAALFCAVAIAIVLPTIALAAVEGSSAGLVPCGVSSDPLLATECEACNVVQLVQNVIMFLIGLAIPIAMVMFTWAGILYFTSGAGGGNENISKAKRIFSSSLFGFVLALAAWLIVNTILYTVLDKNLYPNSSWFHIDCSTAERVRTRSVGDVLFSHLGIAPTVQPVVTTPVYSCVNQGPDFALITLSDGNQVCMNGDGKKVSPTITQTFGSGSGVVCPAGNTACSVQAIMSRTGVSLARAQAMSCIAMTESSGNQMARSTVPGSSACGTFQVLEKTHWSNPQINSGACRNMSCTNAECNIKVAMALGNARKASGQSYYADWTCPNCNNKAAACVAKYDPGN